MGLAQVIGVVPAFICTGYLLCWSFSIIFMDAVFPDHVVISMLLAIPAAFLVFCLIINGIKLLVLLVAVTVSAVLRKPFIVRPKVRQENETYPGKPLVRFKLFDRDIGFLKNVIPTFRDPAKFNNYWIYQLKDLGDEKGRWSSQLFESRLDLNFQVKSAFSYRIIEGSVARIQYKRSGAFSYCYVIRQIKPLMLNKLRSELK